MGSLDRYPVLGNFVGFFYPVHIAATWYWVFVVLAFVYLILNKGMSGRTIRLIMDGALSLGCVLFVTYVLYAVLAYTDEIKTANQLGGMSENERNSLFVYFRAFLAWRTSMLVLFMATAFFERHSLLPYVEHARRRKSSAASQRPPPPENGK